MKTQFEWQIVPHPIAALKPADGTSYFVGIGNGTSWVKAFCQRGAWCYADTSDVRLGSAILPQPTHFLTPVDENPLPGSAEARVGWTCGNGALSARYLLLLIERNPAMALGQIEWIADLIDQAGPAFTQARLNFFTAPLDEEVPF